MNIKLKALASLNSFFLKLNVFEIIFDGVLVGLILVLFVGPAFFYLIKVSLERGFLSASIFALGIIVSDLLLITLIYYGFSNVLESKLFQQIFSLSSGLVLIGLGFFTFAKDINKKKDLEIEKGHHPFWYFFKGMFINGINPFTLMIWLGVVGAVGVRQTYSEVEFRYFFMGLLSMILFADIIKAYFAHKIKLLLNDRLIRKVNRFLAIIFIVLGLRMILFFFDLIFNWEGIF